MVSRPVASPAPTTSPARAADAAEPRWPSGEQAEIETRARLQDALDALQAAILWLHGEYRDTPRSKFNSESWWRKARSGVVGLRNILSILADHAPAELAVVWDEADNMCPNCVTPWKCNGPHLSEQTAAAKPAEPRWPSGELDPPDYLRESVSTREQRRIIRDWLASPEAEQELAAAIADRPWGRADESRGFARALLAALHPGDAG